MHLIDQQPHFWELYQDHDHYYLSIAVDLSSVVSCWDVVLDQDEILSYEHRGRTSIESLAKTMVEAAYRGDFSAMESRLAKPYQRQLMQTAYKTWKTEQS